MKTITWLGALLLLLGIAGLLVPKFSTTQTTDLANVGDVTVQDKTITHHMVSQPLTIAVLLLGVALIGTGAYVRETE